MGSVWSNPLKVITECNVIFGVMVMFEIRSFISWEFIYPRWMDQYRRGMLCWITCAASKSRYYVGILNPSISLIRKMSVTAISRLRPTPMKLALQAPSWVWQFVLNLNETGLSQGYCIWTLPPRTWQCRRPQVSKTSGVSWGLWLATDTVSCIAYNSVYHQQSRAGRGICQLAAYGVPPQASHSESKNRDPSTGLAPRMVSDCGWPRERRINELCVLGCVSTAMRIVATCVAEPQNSWQTRDMLVCFCAESTGEHLRSPNKNNKKKRK